MPYVKCPVCGLVQHVVVVSMDQWFRKLKPKEMPEQLCFQHWKEAESAKAATKEE